VGAAAVVAVSVGAEGGGAEGGAEGSVEGAGAGVDGGDGGGEAAAGGPGAEEHSAVARLLTQLEGAHFTVASDKAMVASRCKEYARALMLTLQHASDGLVPEPVIAYAGERNANGEPEGYGTLRDAGHVYEGQFRNGCRHGFGTQTYVDGSLYVGEWGCGKRHGEGTLMNAGGDERYEGEWHADRRHGEGRIEKLRVTTVEIGGEGGGAEGGGGVSAHRGTHGGESGGGESGGGGSVCSSPGGGGTAHSPGGGSSAHSPHGRGPRTQDVLEWVTVWQGQHVYGEKASRRADEDAPAALRAALNAAVPLTEPSNAPTTNRFQYRR
jgi:hypothetical protein